MTKFATWSPYVPAYEPRHLVVAPDGRPVVTADIVHRVQAGYKIQPLKKLEGLGAAMPETPIHIKETVVDESDAVVAIVEGAGKVFPGFRVRPVTAAEAAITSLH